MNVFIFGNPDFEMDSLPIKLLPDLENALPQHDFIFQDPNEEWDTSEPFFVIDTVVGLPEPHIFDSIDAFERTPQLSMHDFDALSNLRFLKKLGKLPKVKIIGLPPYIERKEALRFISNTLNTLSE